MSYIERLDMTSEEPGKACGSLTNRLLTTWLSQLSRWETGYIPLPLRKQPFGFSGAYIVQEPRCLLILLLVESNNIQNTRVKG